MTDPVSVRITAREASRMARPFVITAVFACTVLCAPPAGSEPESDAELTRLDAAVAAHPGDPDLLWAFAIALARRGAPRVLRKRSRRSRRAGPGDARISRFSWAARSSKRSATPRRSKRSSALSSSIPAPESPICTGASRCAAWGAARRVTDR